MPVGIAIFSRYRPRRICWSFRIRRRPSVLLVANWLCLEAGLAVIRLSIWACKRDDDSDAPPTRDYSRTEQVQTTSHLQQRQREIFTKIQGSASHSSARLSEDFIMSFAGLIGPFGNPDISLYYSLTRDRPSKRKRPCEYKKRGQD